MATVIEPLIRVRTKRRVKNVRPAVRVEQPLPTADGPVASAAQYRLLLHCRGTGPAPRALSPAMEEPS